MYKSLIKPLLFKLEPEKAHAFTLLTTRIAECRPIREILKLFFAAEKYNAPLKCFGLDFQNPIWLASGIDKNAEAIDFFSALGFGSIELGGVVPRPQKGNDKPRLHRFPKQGALINRMGFPTLGCEAVAKNVQAARKRIADPNLKLGMNIAKATTTPIEKAHEDYLESFRVLYDDIDFFTVNISCPNVAAYQVLQEKKNLSRILETLQNNNPLKKPLVIKLSSDLTIEASDEAIQTGIEYAVKGIIATNTSTRRDIFPEGEKLLGGLSGLPLYPIALERIKQITQKFSSQIDIVAVGGIRTEEQVNSMLAAGAKAVQFYTALVYEGPGLVKRLKSSCAI